MSDPGPPSSGEKRVRIAFTGDLCLGGGMQEVLAARGADYPLSEVADLLGRADLTVANLECCLLDQPLDVASIPKNLMLVPAALADGLAGAGVDVCCLANNHVMDAGGAGLRSTLAGLARLGRPAFGAGMDLEAAEAPLVVERNGLRIGFMGACDVPQHYAAEASPGVAPLDERRLLGRVRDLRGEVDVVVVTLHADLEFTAHPSPARVKLSRRLVDAGAHLVIQHHPHVCQGIERRGDGLIAYSLGNFVFRVAGNGYQEAHEGASWSGVLFADLALGPDGVRVAGWRFEPVCITPEHRTVPCEGERATRVTAFLEQISSDLDHPGRLRRAWWARCRTEARSTFYVLYHLRRRAGLAAALREGLRLFLDPRERRWILGAVSGGRLG